MKYHTAPTYENYPRLSEPFTRDNKWYVTVQMKSGLPKDVRAYLDEVVAAASPKWNARKGFGFGEAGFITIFAGEISSEDEYFSKSCARYCVRFGWYIVSTDPVPADLPYYATPKKLLWSAVGNDDGTWKDDKTVNAAVNALIFGASDSQPVGKVGDRLDLVLTVIKATHYETQYGTNTTHTFKDADGNLFKWSTGAKDWAEDTVHKLRGTVKEHKENVTVLTRCSEVS